MREGGDSPFVKIGFCSTLMKDIGMAVKVVSWVLNPDCLLYLMLSKNSVCVQFYDLS